MIPAEEKPEERIDPEAEASLARVEYDAAWAALRAVLKERAAARLGDDARLAAAQERVLVAGKRLRDAQRRVRASVQQVP